MFYGTLTHDAAEINYEFKILKTVQGNIIVIKIEKIIPYQSS